MLAAKDRVMLEPPTVSLPAGVEVRKIFPARDVTALYSLVVTIK
jgi:hypothetical protein